MAGDRKLLQICPQQGANDPLLLFVFVTNTMSCISRKWQGDFENSPLSIQHIFGPYTAAVGFCDQFHDV